MTMCWVYKVSCIDIFDEITAWIFPSFEGLTFQNKNSTPKYIEEAL